MKHKKFLLLKGKKDKEEQKSDVKATMQGCAIENYLVMKP